MGWVKCKIKKIHENIITPERCGLWSTQVEAGYSQVLLHCVLCQGYMPDTSGDVSRDICHEHGGTEHVQESVSTPTECNMAVMT